jgi:hypothetical protein
MSDPNWAEQVTAIATAIGAIGLVSAIGAAVFAAQQVREARQSRQVQVGADFVRRWDEAELVAARHLVAQFRTGDELRDAFRRLIETNSVDAFAMYHELDYFEQLGALEELGAVPFDLVRLLLGRRLIERWELWKPSLDMLGSDAYPMFTTLVKKMRSSLGTAPAAA